jgi:hypothetical protein
VLGVLVRKLFWDGVRRFFYEDLVRSCPRSFFDNLVIFFSRSWHEDLLNVF